VTSKLSVVVGIAALAAACAKPRPPAKPVAVAKPKLKLAILAVESEAFPKVAQAATDSLARVQQVKGVDEVEVSKVSLEVVQLSIECVEPTDTCYEAVGKSLAANRLLFAQVGPGVIKRGKKRDVRVTITLFDVDTRASQKTAEKVFPSEKDATAGVDTLIAEATN
jgi:hypothetical protein